MAAKKTEKKKVGRPTKFKPEFYEQVMKYCLLGAKNDELAEHLGISTMTLQNWMVTDEKFVSTIRAGREEANANVATKTYHRAIGYEHIETEEVLVNGQPVEIKRKRYYPPETTAAIFWLCNRRPDKWRRGERQETVDSAADQAKAVHTLVKALFEAEGE